MPKFDIVIVKIRFTPSWAVRCLTAAENFLRSRKNWRRFAILYRGVHAFGAAAGLVLCATTTADVPAALVKPIPDPRIARLEKFFRRYNCPAPLRVPEYLRAADQYGLDYRLLPAISIRETHCGIQEKDNNRLGYHPGQGGFPSIEICIDFVGKRLAQHRYYRGKNLQDKLFTYNPRQAYPGEVKHIMRQIEESNPFASEIATPTLPLQTR